MQAVMEHGVVIVDNIPSCPDSSVLLDFVNNHLGGMQKDPAREEPNWVIKKKAGAVSVSYAQERRNFGAMNTFFFFWNPYRLNNLGIHDGINLRTLRGFATNCFVIIIVVPLVFRQPINYGNRSYFYKPNSTQDRLLARSEE